MSDLSLSRPQASSLPIAPNAARRLLARYGWVLLILLVAAALRLYALADVPPGLTHDEADHGLTAWSIVNGARGLYFTIGYGREPLYDYAVAALMALLGPTYLAGRLAAVFFSLLMLSGMFAWARRAFDRPTALLAAAGLAVGFWPVMAGRQMLRSIVLPALFVFAVYFAWEGLRVLASKAGGRRRSVPAPFLLAGLFLGLTFYTYIPARVMWLVFPLLGIYLTLVARRPPSRLWSALGFMLLVAAVVGAPLFLYLAENPGLEVRINELSAPLRAAAGGDWRPLWHNALGSLALFTVRGDETWRYNIPGRPWLSPLMGLLFYAGLLWAIRLAWLGLRRPTSLIGPQPAAFLALAWLTAGFSPALVAGPGLTMTQAIGMMPVLFLFPALALAAGYRRAEARLAHDPQAARTLQRLAVVAAAALFLGEAALTVRDYFDRWANDPAVRVQYESTQMAIMDYLNRAETGATAVSTITPGRYHTPALALVTLHEPDKTPRWFDARQALILPQPPATLFVPGFTPLPEALLPYLNAAGEPQSEIPMRPTDLDRPVAIYALLEPGAPDAFAPRLSVETGDGVLPLPFGDSLELIGYELPAAIVRPGETVQIVTVWRLLAPLDDAALFSHLLAGGLPIAQDDRLGAPGEAWRPGDVLVQLHEFVIPPETAAGEYPLVVGVYTQGDGRRLPVRTATGTAEFLPLAPVKVGP